MEDESEEESESEDDSEDEVNGLPVNVVLEKVEKPKMTEEHVRSGRKEEVDFMNNLKVFKLADVEECWRKTGKAPISTMWLDNMKMADNGEWEARCRLVGRDFKPAGDNGREDLFAAMPPLEAKKLMFRMAAAENGRRVREGGEEIVLMFLDVRKAHLNAVCKVDAYVTLPSEFDAKGKCGKLERWLYGMRPAAAGWEDDYAEKLEAVGFERGVAAPTVFYHRKKGIRVVVHGDDFTFSGTRSQLIKMRSEIKRWYEVKDRGMMGSGAEDIKQVVILGRTLRWYPDKLELWADDGHRRKVMEANNLTESSNALEGPAAKAEDKKRDPTSYDDQKEKSEIIDPKVKTAFRGMSARLNYLSQDRCDIQFATKCICSDMSRPSEEGLAKIKHTARYLVGASRLVWTFRFDDENTDMIECYVDSDWAGNKTTRKSTSGGLMAVGGTCVKSWSRSQKSRALSSGEAEYYAMVGGAAEALGFQALAADLGWKMGVRVWTDSKAGKGMASRRGLGKTRHVEVKYLWLQQAVKKKRLTLWKIWGKANPADHLTKAQNKQEFVGVLKNIGGRIEERSEGQRF